MTSRTALRLVRLYPHRWRARYGEEFAALLEQHPFSFKTFANVLCSAGEAHMRAVMLQERDEGIVVGWVWCAWMTSVIAGLILYGMVDDSPLQTAMTESFTVAISWKIIQAGCVLAASAIAVAGLPLAWSMGLFALRERRHATYLKLAIPFISLFAFVGWMAVVLLFTRGQWAASPWAVAFSRPYWPSNSVRWITGSISAALLVLGCIASAASVSQLVRTSKFPDFRIGFRAVGLNVSPLLFATALAPWAATGILIMLTGAVIWGLTASRLCPVAFRSLSGPLGLSGLASWIVSTAIFGFAAAIAGQAAWRSRTPSTLR